MTRDIALRRFAGLEESRDELQAAAALQAGRELLMLNPCNNNAEKGPSLAVELLAGMNSDQVFFPDGLICVACVSYKKLNFVHKTKISQLLNVRRNTTYIYVTTNCRI